MLTQGWVLGEALHTHGLARDHLHDGSVPGFQRFRVVLQLLARAPVDLLLQLGKLAGNVSSVAVNYRGISGADLTRVVQDDHLKCVRRNKIRTRPEASAGRKGGSRSRGKCTAKLCCPLVEEN